MCGIAGVALSDPRRPVSRDLVGRMAATLRASGYGTRSITAIHNGIDLRLVRAARGRDTLRRELGIEAGALVIGTAGRLSPVKAHAILLRAGARIVQERPAVRWRGPI